MNIFKIKLCYQGTNYFGWQIQPKSFPTIQGDINKSLEKICKSSDIKTIGASRTDRGVHALAQIVRVEIPLKIDCHSLRQALNSHLANDIRILEVEQIKEDFHPIYDCVSKEYFYLFSNTFESSPFQNNFMANCSYQLDQKKMVEALNLFKGEHDFCNFFCQGSVVNSTVREIFHIELQQQKSENSTFSALFPPHYKLLIKGNGFLKQMVRLIVGTLWAIGRKQVTLSQLQIALSEKGPEKLGIVAPAAGLYLNKINFSSG